jgi:hypothetical protein
MASVASLWSVGPHARFGGVVGARLDPPRLAVLVLELPEEGDVRVERGDFRLDRGESRLLLVGPRVRGDVQQLQAFGLQFRFAIEQRVQSRGHLASYGTPLEMTKGAYRSRC